MNEKKIFVATVGGGFEHPKIVGRRKVGNRIFKIAIMKKKPKDGWIGGNMESFRLLGVPNNLPYNEIVFWNGYGKKVSKHTIQHELDEEHLERYGHMNYHPAHDYSLIYESTNLSPMEVLRRCRGE
jgi:hypothetical protein